MAGYSELISQAQALMAQAEAIRAQERGNVIAEIRKMMAEHGISADELGASGRKSRKGAKVKAEAKYKGPNGELWSGGPGRRPAWVKELTDKGVDIEQYRI